MKAVIQCVSSAKVEVEQQVIGQINKGYLIFLGIEKTDTKETADKLLAKILKLRINHDQNGKTNLNIKDFGGELLVVSQFTLCADLNRGNRPSFNGAQPSLAKELYDYFCQQASQHIPVQTGEFGSDMLVSLVNVGPSTYLLD